MYTNRLRSPYYNIYQSSVQRYAKFLEVPPRTLYRDTTLGQLPLAVSRAVAARWLWTVGCGLLAVGFLLCCVCDRKKRAEQVTSFLLWEFQSNRVVF